MRRPSRPGGRLRSRGTAPPCCHLNTAWPGAGPVKALVLSGGGLFGAWQAGAWAALAGRFQPDLIVGASVGSLNGYAIACGVSPEKLRELWLTEQRTAFSQLPAHICGLMEHRPQIDFALVITDLLRMK